MNHRRRKGAVDGAEAHSGSSAADSSILTRLKATPGFKISRRKRRCWCACSKRRRDRLAVQVARRHDRVAGDALRVALRVGDVGAQVNAARTAIAHGVEPSTATSRSPRSSFATAYVPDDCGGRRPPRCPGGTARGRTCARPPSAKQPAMTRGPRHAGKERGSLLVRHRHRRVEPPRRAGEREVASWTRPRYLLHLPGP